MEELDFRFKISRLISEDFLGVISEEDREELSAWIDSKEENKKEYDRIVHRLTVGMNKKGHIDIDDEWAIFKNQVLPKRRNLRWWYAAAAVLTGITVLYFIPKEHKPEQVAKVVTQKEIVKERKAVLVLEDGTRMDLSDGKDSVLLSLDDLQIATVSNSLQYQQRNNELGDKARYNTLIIPRGAEYKVHLPDGTIAWLNSSSSLTYPVNFDGDMRKVKMEGEVCFDIAKRHDQPFVVTTGGVSVRVLGTKFNLEAYPSKPVITTLVNGKLEVSDGKQKQIIAPNQQVVISSGKFEVKKVHAADFVQWTNGVFYFSDTALEDIMEKLARWYDVDVIFAEPSAKNARFSLEIQFTDNISSVLSKIEKTGRVGFRIEERRVIVDEQ